MNRLESIKHKGKRIDNGEWVYGFYANGLIDLDGDKEIYRHFIIVWDVDGYFTDYVVDPETVCLNDAILQRLEIAQKALEHYADIELYKGIQQGELFADWFMRQNHVAVQALEKLKEP